MRSNKHICSGWSVHAMSCCVRAKVDHQARLDAGELFQVPCHVCVQAKASVLAWFYPSIVEILPLVIRIIRPNFDSW